MIPYLLNLLHFFCKGDPVREEPWQVRKHLDVRSQGRCLDAGRWTRPRLPRIWDDSGRGESGGHRFGFLIVNRGLYHAMRSAKRALYLYSKVCWRPHSDLPPGAGSLPLRRDVLDRLGFLARLWDAVRRLQQAPAADHTAGGPVSQLAVLIRNTMYSNLRMMRWINWIGQLKQILSKYVQYSTQKVQTCKNFHYSVYSTVCRTSINMTN